MDKQYVFTGGLHSENESGHLCEVECCQPVYLASDVDARIAELEREKHDLQSALRELLQDTQHVNHNCGDTSDRCPVLRAREVLNELMER